MAQLARQELLNDPAIARVRDEIRRLYGDRLVRLVLYRSRARGDADPESDYDFAVSSMARSSRTAGPLS